MKKRPNILLLISDHHRGDWMPYTDETKKKLDIESLPIKMPTVQNLMENGTSFTNCITPSPLCIPARCCLASGLNYEHIGVPDNKSEYPLSQRTFYSVLRSAGYNVGGVGKFHLHSTKIKESKIKGYYDELNTMGFTHGLDNNGKIGALYTGIHEPQDAYMKYIYDNGLQDIYIKDMRKRDDDNFDTSHTELPEEAYCDNWLTDNGINMLQEFDKNKPWLLLVNFIGPHPPWDITKRMKERWQDVTLPQPKGYSDDMPPEKINEIRQNFAAMIENIDRNIALLKEAVEARGELDNTIIIYTADHGDSLGDNNLFGKCNPFRGSVSIPLVFWGKDIVEGVETEMLTELQDVASTIVDFCGETMPEARDSISLKDFLKGKNQNAIRHSQTSELWNWRMESDGKRKTIYNDGDISEIYDLENDMWEQSNLHENGKAIDFKNIFKNHDDFFEKNKLP